MVLNFELPDIDFKGVNMKANPSYLYNLRTEMPDFILLDRFNTIKNQFYKDIRNDVEVLDHYMNELEVRNIKYCV